LLLQYLKEVSIPNYKKLYFSENSLLDVASQFYKSGGKILVLDEVHKYHHWSRGIKNLYDRYDDLQIIFTGSSVLEITKQEGDLSRRVKEIRSESFSNSIVTG